jgi:hypothetical protein
MASARRKALAGTGLHCMLKTNLSGDSGQAKILALGGRRRSLKRLNPAKEIQGFSLLKFGRILLDSVPAWVDLDLRVNLHNLLYNVLSYTPSP